MDTIELLNQVDQFYNSAWNKLIIYTTILIGIVGVLVPLIISWWQNRTLKIKEESLRKEFETLMVKKLVPLKNELTELIKNELKNEFEIFKEQIDYEMSLINAGTFHIKGNNNLKDKSYKLAVDNYITAGYGYLKGKDFANLNKINSLILKNIHNCSKEQIEDLETEKSEPSAYITKLDESNTNGIFTDFILDIKREINKIMKEETRNKFSL